MTSSNIDSWPQVLKNQLEASLSHLPLVAEIGFAHSRIAIFELLSRAPLPPGYVKPIMSRIPESGVSSLNNQLIGPEPSSAGLANYSLVAVRLAMSEFQISKRKISAVKKLINDSMRAATKHEQLLSDIYISARMMARLRRIEENPTTPTPQRKETIYLMDSYAPGDFNGLDRPTDWKTSHWWTGE